MKRACFCHTLHALERFNYLEVDVTFHHIHKYHAFFDPVIHFILCGPLWYLIHYFIIMRIIIQIGSFRYNTQLEKDATQPCLLEHSMGERQQPVQPMWQNWISMELRGYVMRINKCTLQNNESCLYFEWHPAWQMAYLLPHVPLQFSVPILWTYKFPSYCTLNLFSAN